MQWSATEFMNKIDETDRKSMERLSKLDVQLAANMTEAFDKMLDDLGLSKDELKPGELEQYMGTLEDKCAELGQGYRQVDILRGLMLLQNQQ